MAERCAAQYAFRYRHGLKQPPSAAIVRGKAVDDEQTKQVGNRINGDPMDSVSEAKDHAVHLVERSFLEDEVVTSPDEGEDEIKDQVVRYVDTAYEAIWEPVTDPVAVQEKIRMELPDGEGGTMELLGYSDLRTLAGIRDLKTTKRKWPAGKEASEKQAQVYGVWDLLRTGNEGTEFTYDILIGRKNGEVVYDQRTVPVTLESAQPVFRELIWRHNIVTRQDQVAEQHGEDVAFPPNRGSFLCSRRWCGFWSSCEAKFPALGPVKE